MLPASPRCTNALNDAQGRGGASGRRPRSATHTASQPHGSCALPVSPQDLKTVLSLPQHPGEFLHPVVYACTAVMLLCVLAAAITYLVHRR